MLKLYTQTSCRSSRSARKWLRNHQIDFEETNFSQVAPTVAELKHILSLTENGLVDIISTRAKNYPAVAERLPKMSFNEALELLCAQPKLLRRPIIVSENKIQIGFNQDDIRQFLPRYIRRLKFEQLLKRAKVGELSLSNDVS